MLSIHTFLQHIKKVKNCSENSQILNLFGAQPALVERFILLISAMFFCRWDILSFMLRQNLKKNFEMLHSGSAVSFSQDNKDNKLKARLEVVQ